MPNITKVDLSRYRFQKAEEMLASAKRDMEARDYASANNRAYYAIFHAMRAVLALDGEDFRKHSAVIARFTLNYLKPEILPREYSKLISNASLIRNRSDYEDFYICSVADTNALFSGAVTFCGDVGEYLEQRYRTEL
ncbi:HEPN domain-containing protein [Pseudoflavonifractor sp. 60]|uniref:HEPN domain-containing protein n=1 Tax=Pseudoflavonifractor sp. 60 TaxID=2304576 RepID=UPI00136817D0|nr:HEPN domain-containing protein [Lawsonibacter sp.]NBI66558.1 HEPN domain-containing protein [Pseudoflavonifractor sp. 60]